MNKKSFLNIKKLAVNEKLVKEAKLFYEKNGKIHFRDLMQHLGCTEEKAFTIIDILYCEHVIDFGQVLNATFRNYADI